jgi:hypothetical protein
LATVECGCRQEILDNIADWLGIRPHMYPDEVLQYEVNVGVSQRGAEQPRLSEKGGDETLESEEQEVLTKGLGDCGAALGELLGGWDLDY